MSREQGVSAGERRQRQFETAKAAFDGACADFDQQMGWERAWVNPGNWGVHPQRGELIYSSDMFSSGAGDGRNETAKTLRQAHQDLAERFEALSPQQQRRLVPYPTFSIKRRIAGFEPTSRDHYSDHSFLSEKAKTLTFEFDFAAIVEGRRAGNYIAQFDAAKRSTIPRDGFDSGWESTQPRFDAEAFGRDWLSYHQNYLDSAARAAYCLTYGIYEFKNEGEYLTPGEEEAHQSGLPAVEELDEQLSRFYINALEFGDNGTRRILTYWLWELNGQLFRHNRISRSLGQRLLDHATTDVEKALSFIGKKVINAGRRGPGLNVYEWD